MFRLLNFEPSSGFHRAVDEICVLLGYYTAYSGNTLPTFRDDLLVPTLGGQEIQEEKRSFDPVFLDPRRWDLQVVPNAGNEITTLRCLYPRRVRKSSSDYVTKLRKVYKRNSVNVYEILKFSVNKFSLIQVKVIKLPYKDYERQQFLR